MVAYGDALRLSRRPGWEEAYIDHQNLQVALRTLETERTSPTSSSSPSCSDHNMKDNKNQQDDVNKHTQRNNKDKNKNKKPLPPFEILLEREIEKVSFFALHQQGEIAQHIGALRLLQLGRPWFRVAVDPTSQAFRQLRQGASVTAVTASKRRFRLDDNDSDDDEYEEDKDKGADDEETALLSPTLSTSSFPKSSSATVEYPTRPIFPAMSTSSSSAASSSLSSSTDDMDLILAFTHWGIELLHIQRYVSINTVGIRKIVKKYLRRNRRQQQRSNVEHLESTTATSDTTAIIKANLMATFPATRSHGKQLASMGASIQALYETLNMACALLQQPNKENKKNGTSSSPSRGDHHTDDARYYAWIRLYCTVALIEVLQTFADRTIESFSAFLSSQSMIAQQEDLSREALTMILRCQPDILKEMEPDQLDAWFTRQQMADGLLETFRSTQDGATKGYAWGGVDSFSLALNLLSTLLYTVNYYIVAPTANRYAILLGVDGAFGATLVGASSLSALATAFLFSAWYTRFSFRSALVFSAVCPCIGNLLYAIAISYHSLPMALWGRILVGFGSAEVVNRQLIGACVSFQHLTSASAYFVAAGAVGMSIGPLLAALLDMFAGRDLDIDVPLPFMPAGGIIYNHVTSPGFVTAGMWFLQGLAVLLCFREPNRIHAERKVSNDDDSGGNDRESKSSIYSSFDERAKVTLESVGVHVHAAPRQIDGTQQKVSVWQSFWNEMGIMRKLIFGNVALPITLFLFGLIELVCEVLISSCAMIGKNYFGWFGSTAGFLLASLGALVLPAHFFVEKAAHRFEERIIIKYSILFILLGFFGIMNYEGIVFDGIGIAAGMFGLSKKEHSVTTNSTEHVSIAIGGKDIMEVLNEQQEVPYDWGAGRPVYLTFLCAIFMGTIILEGVDTSVMAKATPVALNETFINSGLLATLVGTLGRVLGDSLITLSVFLDKDVFTDFVNATFSALIPLTLLGYFFVRRNFDELVEE